MGGLITLVFITIGMYKIAESSSLPGWLWATMNVLLFLAGTSIFVDIPGLVIAGLAGILCFLLMTIFKMVTNS